MKLKNIFVGALAVLTLAACGNHSETAKQQENNTKATQVKKVSVAVNGTKHEAWDHVKKELKEKENIDLDIKEFEDYVTPNTAVEDGSVDFNSFQTIIYLEKFNKEKGTHIKPIAYTVIAPMGVYSKKLSSLSDLKDGDKVAIPNDTSNNSRALRLLHAAGVIKLDDVNNTLVTKDNIVENPKKLDIIELPAGQTYRALEEVAISVINSGYAVEAGLDPKTEAKFLEEVTDASKPYYNVIAVKEGRENEDIFKTIVKYYQSPETAKIIEESTKGASIPVWEKATLK